MKQCNRWCEKDAETMSMYGRCSMRGRALRVLTSVFGGVIWVFSKQPERQHVPAGGVRKCERMTASAVARSMTRGPVPLRYE